MKHLQLHIATHSYKTLNRFAQRLVLLLCVVVSTTIPAWSRPNEKLLNRPYADLKRWHLGFSVGTHVQDLDFTHNGAVAPDGASWFVEVPSFSPGFCVNVLADLRLHKYFNLRFTPGMYFGSKTAEMIGYDSPTRLRQDIKTAYVVTPLDLKISGDRLRNCRPYAVVGGMAAFDVSKKRSEYLQFNTADFYLTAGFGVDFYLPFFKFNPEIKFCFGLTDILRHDRPDLDDDPETYKITQALTKVKSKMVVLTFYFE